MSNHSGSYMLNEMLQEMIEIGIFEKLNKKDSRALLKTVLSTGDQYDCNPGEILEDIGEDFEICYCCLKFDLPLKRGICQKCGSWAFG